MLIAFGIFLFLMLVVVHEYGHFLVAKRNGVEVEEFGVGFPPENIWQNYG
jgi:regulator of sigma E protease